MSKDYRAGVVGVFYQWKNDQVLMCERADRTGVWQFPQGGLDENETPEQGLWREMREELGTSKFYIIRVGEGVTQYDFPVTATFSLAKKFVGQRHHWFLLAFDSGCGPDLAKADGEFRAVQWIPRENCLDTVTKWKRDAYQVGLSLLGIGGGNA